MAKVPYSFTHYLTVLIPGVGIMFHGSPCHKVTGVRIVTVDGYSSRYQGMKVVRYGVMWLLHQYNIYT